ncbi:hypothetical protein [Mesorhizobium caraganae]|uniref:hypothetical protein n=1 Tax=Mesorhizobium caraganae TaxID=483206 RepID=UPI001FEEA5BB|nr:hypothetical protein [Mesorhizobium caraganae]
MRSCRPIAFKPAKPVVTPIRATCSGLMALLLNGGRRPRPVSAALFLSVQVLICIGAVYWAIAETLGMAGTATLVLAAIFALPSAYVLFIPVRMACEAETDPANQ